MPIYIDIASNSTTILFVLVYPSSHYKVRAWQNQSNKPKKEGQDIKKADEVGIAQYNRVSK